MFDRNNAPAKRRPGFRLPYSALVLVLACAACAQPQDSLRAGFAAPPATARPRVWWHWMNGNISKEGAKLDLEWLHRVGIGGVQLFEGGLGTPLMAKKRLVYMSPEWREVLVSSVDTAHQLGMEMSITTAPGWSETGGPWVTPDQAMKKLVWSQTDLRGGQHFNGLLPSAPAVAGPFQDIPLSAIEPADWLKDSTGFVRDVAVIAYRQSGKDAAMRISPAASASIGAIDGALLRDGRYAGSIMLPADPAKGPGWIKLDYGVPVTVRSVIVGMPGKRGFGAPKPADARLESSDDGVTFRPVTTLLPTRSPVRSASFAPVTARWFRLSVEAGSGVTFADDIFPVPGAVLPPFQPGNAAYAVSELTLSARARIDHSEEKAGFAAAPDYYAIATPPAAVDHAVAQADVIDITSHMTADGRLDWTPPAGDWKVIRFGYSLTGHPNGPAPAEATGLEADKLSARHISDYLDTYLGMYQTVLGPDRIGKNAGIGSLLSDSIEAGPQNWTEDMVGEFTRRRGYDPTPWLPALTGVVIGSAEASDRFLWDFRRTIAELTAQAHYGTIAKAAHARGLYYYSEALEDGRPSLGDDMEMRTPADVPMGAMWMLPPSGKAIPTYVADLKGAASVAHAYGKPLVASETFTVGGRPWAMSPRDLKSTADFAFTLGVNRIVYHTSPHQPVVEGGAPGVAMMTFVGQYFDRNETWAEQAGPWIDYLSRSAFMLQQGRYVADVAYFYGEEAPLTGMYQHNLFTDVPPGRPYDFVNAAGLRDRLSVAPDGDLVTADGMRYPVLMLGGSSRKMTLATLQRVHALLNAGATVVGTRPDGSPSGADDAAAFSREADAIWGGGTTAVGKGHVFADLPSAFAARGLAPDWDTGGADVDIAAIHRQTGDGDIYFVVNRRASAARFDMALRATGHDVQLWHADTGTATPANFKRAPGKTLVPLNLAPNEAVFVVLRGKSKGESRQVAAPVVAPLAELDGGWTLAFQPGRGAPAAPIQLDRLSSWSLSPDSGISHFSGTATYTRDFTVPHSAATGPVFLNLGDVDDIAEVSVNGKAIGTLWKAPYRIDIATALNAGANHLEIKVTNLWVNRLIGDAQPDAKHRYTVVPTPAYLASAPLLPSGLLGPVRLEQEK